jgi:hypothetical protein
MATTPIQILSISSFIIIIIIILAFDANSSLELLTLSLNR